MIELIQVSKIFNRGKRNEKTVLDRIHLTIHEGEMTAIMGKSGAGKTTLINLIGAVDQATKGKIMFKGTDLTRFKEREMAAFRANHVGIVLQNFALLLNETVASNVSLPLYFSKKRKKDTLSVKKALELCRIPGFEKRKVSELSGGEMQRVAIARALITQPELIIADEPTGALDSTTSKEIISLLQELNRQGKTILMVTHDAEIAASCRRLLHIQDGRIQESDLAKQ